MPAQTDDFLPTRRSLLTRLKNWDDQQGWTEFLDIYGKLIYGFALKSDLNETDAEDVLQETLLSAAKQLPNFKYDRARGSFKSWLLQITRRRIADHWRKQYASSGDPASASDVPDQLTDPAGSDLDQLWDAEWQQNLLSAATQRLKRQLSPKQFQMFDLYVLQQWPLEKVRTTLRVSAAQIYMAKYRANGLLKKELHRLETGILQ